jgi:acyl-CoA synthetase (AMP-forming)/AMP-acid ligase II
VHEDLTPVLDNSNAAGACREFYSQVAVRADQVAIQFRGRHVTYAELAALAEQPASEVFRRRSTGERVFSVLLSDPVHYLAAVLGILGAEATCALLGTTLPCPVLESALSGQAIRTVVTDGALPGQFSYESVRPDVLDQRQPDSKARVLPGTVLISLYPTPGGSCLAVPLSGADLSRWLAFLRAELSGSSSVVLDLGHRRELSTLAALAILAEGGVLQVMDSRPRDGSIGWSGDEGDALCCPLSTLQARDVQETVGRWVRGKRRLKVLTWGEKVLAPGCLHSLLQEAGVPWCNLYGFPLPVATTALAPDALSSEGARVHLGHPLPWLRAAVLDALGRPLPLGVLGELAVGDAPDGVGEWEQMASSPDAVRRTRICARRRPRHQIEFRGRLDGWTSVNDQPLLLDLVDQLAGPLTSTNATVTCVQARPDGREQLVVYVGSPRSVLPENHAHWNLQLQALLPASVLPAGFVSLASLPFTAAGDVDVQRLAAANLLDSATLDRIRKELERVVGPGRFSLGVEERLETPAPWVFESRTQGRADGRDSVSAERPAEEVGQRAGPPSYAFGGLLPEADQPPRTLIAALESAAARAGTVRCVAVDGTTLHWTYAELASQARRVLGGLQRSGLRPGDLVLLQLEPVREFLAGVWACWLGGLVAVPVAVPRAYDGENAACAKLRHVWHRFGSPPALTTHSRQSHLAEAGLRWNLAAPRVLAIEDCREEGPAGAVRPGDGDDPVLIMPTSGSTAAPKGVTLRHRNITLMSRAIARLNGYRQEDVSLNWLPLDHVGGVVMFHLRDVVLGCRQIQVETDYILQDPLRWLDLLDQYRVTVTWAPNFAFELVNREAERIRRGRWNLSAVRVIPNGGEVVNVETARRFLELLRPHGLPLTAMRPGFGMSETSSSIISSERFQLGSDCSVHRINHPAAGSPIQRCPPGHGMDYPEVGLPACGVEVRIVDDGDRVVAEETVGHLQVRGPQVMSGYYGDAQATAQAFTPDGWLRTGDLGFLRDGRLTITGREKDVVIINGLNYSGRAIEAAVEAVPGVRASHVAACGVYDAEQRRETLVIFYSLADGAAGPSSSLTTSIQDAVLASVGLQPDVLVALPPDRIPKTEIGKIQRSRLKADYLAGRFVQEVVRPREHPPGRAGAGVVLHAVLAAVSLAADRPSTGRDALHCL